MRSRWSAAVLLYGVVRVMAGPVGGVAAALLFCGSSYVPLHMVRAMGEPPFVVFLLATLLVSLVAVRRGAVRGPSVGLGVPAGVLLGLAFASKLTAIIAIVAVVLWGVWAAVGGVVARRLAMLREHDYGRRWLVWSLGVVAVAVLTFVVTNPFLYHDPVGRSWLLFANRQAEMAAQAEIDPSRAVTSLPERARLVWKYSLIEDTWAHTRLRWPLEAVLAVVGFAWLLARRCGSSRCRGVPAALGARVRRRGDARPGLRARPLLHPDGDDGPVARRAGGRVGHSPRVGRGAAAGSARLDEQSPAVGERVGQHVAGRRRASRRRSSQARQVRGASAMATWPAT